MRDVVLGKTTHDGTSFLQLLSHGKNQIPKRREAEENHLVLEHVFLGILAFPSLEMLFQPTKILSAVMHGSIPFSACLLLARFPPSRVFISPGVCIDSKYVSVEDVSPVTFLTAASCHLT
jgi:hypothetical protein